MKSNDNIMILNNGLAVRYFLCNSKNKGHFFSISPGIEISSRGNKKSTFAQPVYAECDEYNVLATNNPEIIDFVLKSVRILFETTLSSKIVSGKATKKTIINELFVGISPFDEALIQNTSIPYKVHYGIKDISKNAKIIRDLNCSPDLSDNSQGKYYYKKQGDFNQTIQLLKKKSEEIDAKTLEIQNFTKQKALNIFNKIKGNKLLYPELTKKIIDEMDKNSIPKSIQEKLCLI